MSGLPLRVQGAVLGLVEAADHYDNPDALFAAVQIHLRGLDTEELIATTGMITTVLSMAFDFGHDKAQEWVRATYAPVRPPDGSQPPTGDPT